MILDKKHTEDMMHYTSDFRSIQGTKASTGWSNLFMGLWLHMFHDGLIQTKLYCKGADLSLHLLHG